MDKHIESSHSIPSLPTICNKYIDIFWGHVDRGEEHECWLWTGGLGVDGYGKAFNGKTVRAHRLSWLIHRGPIPDGAQVLHNCPTGDNCRCVNPAHLWLGTNLNNMADMVAKGRQVMGDRQHSAKLDASKVKAIRQLRASGQSFRAIGQQFGVCLQTISRIAYGQTWKQVK